jgi:hypothetical protein
MTKPTERLTHLVSGLIGVMFLLLCGVNPLYAQQPPPGSPSVKDPKFDTLERQNREATLRSAELPPAMAKTDEQRIAAAVEKIKEDFRRIQIVRNEVARAVLANKPFDYKFVLDETAEVNKRAERLKSYLSPASPEKDKTQAKDEGAAPAELSEKDMKGALARLCHLIDAFVEDPALKNPRTIDLKQSMKIGVDLLGIMDLSNRIMQAAEKLSKPTK